MRRVIVPAAQAFDDALNGRATRGSEASEAAELVRVAELVCRSAAAEPSADFRSALRERLMAEAADVLVVAEAPAPKATPAPRRIASRRRRVVGLAAAAVTSVTTIGLAGVSASAVPGDVLYPVKRGLESVQASIQRDDASRGQFELDQARERLAEAVYLRANDREKLVPSTLEAFTEQADSGTDRVLEAYAEDGDAQTLAPVQDFVAVASVELAQLSAGAPDDARAALVSAAQSVTDAVSEVQAACASCETTDVSALVEAVSDLAPTGGTAAPATQKSTPAKSAEPSPKPAPSKRTPVTGSGSGTTSGSTGSVTGGTKPPVVMPPSGGSPVVPAKPKPVPPLLGDDGVVDQLVDGILGTPKK